VIYYTLIFSVEKGKRWKECGGGATHLNQEATAHNLEVNKCTIIVDSKATPPFGAYPCGTGCAAVGIWGGDTIISTACCSSEVTPAPLKVCGFMIYIHSSSFTRCYAEH